MNEETRLSSTCLINQNAAVMKILLHLPKVKFFQDNLSELSIIKTKSYEKKTKNWLIYMDSNKINFHSKVFKKFAHKAAALKK